MNSSPLLVSVNYQYFFNLLTWQGVPFEQVGSLFKSPGFQQHNHLIDVNKIFSTHPRGDLVDRLGRVKSPVNFKVLRPWQLPGQDLDLDVVFETRVKYYVNQNTSLDLFWSGGADSTALVVAFLQHAPCLDQIRLIYSPFSLYENQEFFNFVTKRFPNLNTLDISGDVYLHDNFNGIVVTGHGGDEFTASLDESFVEEYGSDVLLKPWQDFFYQQTRDQDLIDFCTQYFLAAGRPIDTVLDARWWFYATNKSQVFTPRDMSFLFNQSNVCLNRFSAFFDCQEFEDYMWHHSDQIITDVNDYRSYKKFLRQYIYKFYHNENYLHNSAKINSLQFQFYRLKKTELLDLRWIGILEDATVIRTKNLPFLSEKEFRAQYGHSLDYLFNSP